MFVASKKSSSKILHNQQCFYGKRIRPEDQQLFYTVEEGEKAGYCSCKYCSVIGWHYRKEATKIKQFCEENKIFLQHESREIHVQMPLSHWKIVWNGKKERRSSIKRVYNLLEQLENYSKMKGEKIK